MLEACLIGEGELTEDEEDILKKDWTGLCYTAAIQWASEAEQKDWLVIHGTVLSERVGKRIERAWCERAGFVVDLAMPVGARIIEKQTDSIFLSAPVSRKAI